jgi:hypothetical protein
MVIPITECEIICTINSLQSKNSSCYEIYNQILKLCVHHLSESLAYTYNKSKNLGKFPDHPKYTVVNPLFKKRYESQLSNYRSVSLLTGFCKIF